MGVTGKAIDPGVVVGILRIAIQLGFGLCKLITTIINNTGAAASVQGFPILGLLVIGIVSLGVFLL